METPRLTNVFLDLPKLQIKILFWFISFHFNFQKWTFHTTICAVLQFWLDVETPRIELGSKQAAKRLSTYLVFAWFSASSWSKTTYYKLSFFDFKTQSKRLDFYLYFYDASWQNAVNQRFLETFSSRIWCAKARSYYNSDIKQLKRSYFRRLIVWNKFYKNHFSPWYAYIFTDLAVKTSRPHNVIEQGYKSIKLKSKAVCIPL